MKRIKEKNMAMITISAVVLVATNLAIWLAAKEGSIAPVGNSMLWGVFVGLNVASILWAIVLLGLQPMVVSLSYVAGGFLAYKGVEGMTGISVAEVTTAGATYGAFGALAVGNMTTKVRLAFYNSRQVPFIFIIAGLLVLDALLNSGVSSAGGRVILNAVVFPFVLAGVIFGLSWTVLNHFGIGYNPRETALPAEAESEEAVETAEMQEQETVLKIQVPEHIEEAEEVPDAVSETVIEPEVPRMPVEKEIREPAALAESEEEEFFPLEIDNSDEFLVPVENAEFESDVDDDAEDPDDPFSLSRFDSSLYASGALDDFGGGVMIEEPLAAVSVEQDEAAAPVEDTAPAVAEEKEPEPSVSEQKPEPEKKDKSGDWLSGHLDLLNKLK